MEKVAIVKCSDYSIPAVKAAIAKSFDFFEGADKFIRPGEKVLLKLNLIAASKVDIATTDARFVEAIIEIVKEQGGIPFVGDSPAFGSAKGVARSVGILEAAERQQIEIVEFKRNIHYQEGAKITRSVKDFDKIINLPKLKAHSQIRFTGATKNLFGFTKGKVKAWQHFTVKNNLEEFCHMILRIYDRVRPTFTLVDAIDIMENEGPRNGTKRHFGVIFSGINCLSIDAVMAQCLGIDVSNAPLLQTAVKYGYEGISFEEIEVKGETIESIKINDFAYPETLSDISFTLKTVIRSLCLHLWLLLAGEKRKT